jgi:delta 1-pyrroline-5-carboxylate dehydrogenase
LPKECAELDGELDGTALTLKNRPRINRRASSRSFLQTIHRSCGLTGTVFTQNEDKIRQAKQAYHVGNLYFNVSATDSKAGGRDYLLLFQQAKLISQAV